MEKQGVMDRAVEIILCKYQTSTMKFYFLKQSVYWSEAIDQLTTSI
jgi:hypothetical protein